jgi:hypothetical protein
MHPKIKSAKAVGEYTLEIVFDNQYKKRYNIAPLLKKEMFAPLKNSFFFKNVRIEQGGYAIFWDQNIDISEHELWINGEDTP